MFHLSQSEEQSVKVGTLSWLLDVSVTSSVNLASPAVLPEAAAGSAAALSPQFLLGIDVLAQESSRDELQAHVEPTGASV